MRTRTARGMRMSTYSLVLDPAVDSHLGDG